MINTEATVDIKSNNLDRNLVVNKIKNFNLVGMPK